MIPLNVIISRKSPRNNDNKRKRCRCWGVYRPLETNMCYSAWGCIYVVLDTPGLPYMYWARYFTHLVWIKSLTSGTRGGASSRETWWNASVESEYDVKCLDRETVEHVIWTEWYWRSYGYEKSQIKYKIMDNKLQYEMAFSKSTCHTLCNKTLHFAEKTTCGWIHFLNNLYFFLKKIVL